MKNKLTAISILLLAALSCSRGPIPYGKTISIDRQTLEDKVKGGWFAQTIGCTYGCPVEFWYCQRMIDDTVAIPWYDGIIKEKFTSNSGLYDDVYMDLSFLEVMIEQGADAPATAYADHFAHAPFLLFHANQTGRYNVLNGIYPPASGHWMNNPHADDIDFQIESDFIGMVCPGRPDKAAVLSDRIGHMMNYGDGWYGGVFMGTMYSLAYVCDDIEALVRESLNSIPEGTEFRSTIEAVLEAYAEYPDDWKACWQAVEDVFGATDLCPDGVDSPFNIDASINAAYVVIGLLYGNGDFFRTMDIATRCGQDADCNPATAVGILCVMKGYSSIPEEYRKEAENIKDETFPYTSLSLNTATEKTMELMGADENGIKIKVVKPAPVAYEKSFEGLKAKGRVTLDKSFSDSLSFEFDGNSIFVSGGVFELDHNAPYRESYVARAQAWLDGEMVEEFLMPNNFCLRKNELFYKYCIGSGHHTLKIVWENPDPAFRLLASYYTVFDAE